MIQRNPRSFAPTLDGEDGLLLWESMDDTVQEIARFSPEGRQGLPHLRRHDRARLRDHGQVHPAQPAVLRRVRRRVQPAGRRPRLEVHDPRLRRRLRRVLLRVGHHAGRRLRPGADRHVPRSARRRHGLRQALPLDGDGDRQARPVGVRARRDGELHPGAEAGGAGAGRRYPDRQGGRPHLRRRVAAPPAR